MSIASEITRLQQAKADIKTAIENKGVTVPSNAKLDTYNDYIDSIQTGGGGGIDWEDMYTQVLEGTATSVSVPDGTTVLRNQAFYGLATLTDITLPSSLTSIGKNCFQNCTSLTRVTSSATSLGQGAFLGCAAITDIRDVIPSGVTSLPTECFRQCNGIVKAIVPEGVVSIANGWINGSSLISVTYPSTITRIPSMSSSLDWSLIQEIVILATTPQTLNHATSSLGAYTLTFPIYVPDESVDAYKTAYTNYASRITKLSDRPTT